MSEATVPPIERSISNVVSNPNLFAVRDVLRANDAEHPLRTLSDGEPFAPHVSTGATG